MARVHLADHLQILCPACDGWIFGVDRLSRSLCVAFTFPAVIQFYRVHVDELNTEGVRLVLTKHRTAIRPSNFLFLKDKSSQNNSPSGILALQFVPGMNPELDVALRDLDRRFLQLSANQNFH